MPQTHTTGPKHKQMLTTVVIMACLLAAPQRRNPPEAVWLKTVNKTGTFGCGCLFCAVLRVCLCIKNNNTAYTNQSLNPSIT